MKRAIVIALLASAVSAKTPIPIRYAATGAWTPLALAPALWLDASDASTLTLSGTNVTAWADKSGAGNHAVQIGAVTTTPVTSSLLNGRTTLYFDGGDYLLSGFLSATSTTFFAVAKMTGGEVIAGARDSTDTRSFWVCVRLYIWALALAPTQT